MSAYNGQHAKCLKVMVSSTNRVAQQSLQYTLPFKLPGRSSSYSTTPSEFAPDAETVEKFLASEASPNFRGVHRFESGTDVCILIMC